MAQWQDVILGNAAEENPCLFTPGASSILHLQFYITFTSPTSLLPSSHAFPAISYTWEVFGEPSVLPRSGSLHAIVTEGVPARNHYRPNEIELEKGIRNENDMKYVQVSVIVLIVCDKEYKLISIKMEKSYLSITWSFSRITRNI